MEEATYILDALEEDPRFRAGLDLPAWGPAPSSSALLRAVSAAVDPEQRLGRGRFEPWIPAPTSPTGGNA